MRPITGSASGRSSFGRRGNPYRIVQMPTNPGAQWHFERGRASIDTGAEIEVHPDPPTLLSKRQQADCLAHPKRIRPNLQALSFPGHSKTNMCEVRSI